MRINLILMGFIGLSSDYITEFYWVLLNSRVSQLSITRSLLGFFSFNIDQMRIKLIFIDSIGPKSDYILGITERYWVLQGTERN